MEQQITKTDIIKIINNALRLARYNYTNWDEFQKEETIAAEMIIKLRELIK